MTLLVCEGYEPEQAGGLGGAPLARGAVRQRHHDGLEVLAHDLELAHGLELHGLAGEVLLRRHRVGEDVEQQGAAARRVHAERDHVPHHRLHHEPRMRDWSSLCVMIRLGDSAIELCVWPREQIGRYYYSMHWAQLYKQLTN